MEKEYKNIIESLRKILNNIVLDELPFDIAEQVQDLFDKFYEIERNKVCACSGADLREEFYGN